jgi:cysteine desulfurase
VFYLDHNATTPIDPRVAEAMDRCLRAGYANPNSQHAGGREARRVLEEAREAIGQVLGARVGHVDNDRIIITSGGTEANNLALRGLSPGRGRIVISSIEHPSVMQTAAAMQREGCHVQRLPTTIAGRVDLGSLEAWLQEPTRLASVMLGNNETGVLQPVAETVKLCAAHHVPVHTDAAQVVGKLPVHFRDLGVAAMSIAAHKFHGPVGVGALVVRHGISIDPLLWGGFQQSGLRPGTESVVLTVGMKTALQLWQQEAGARQRKLETMRDRLEAMIRDCLPTAVFVGQDAPRLPHTANIAFPGCDRQALLMALDMAGVACSTGSACASGSSDPSPVLLSMGLPAAIVDSALRFSVGIFNTLDEIEEAARRIVGCVRRQAGSRL